MANDIGTYFADKEMFLIEPNWIEDIGTRFQVSRRLLGTGTTVGSLVSLNQDAPVNLTLNYPIESHQNIYELLDFFNSRKAKTESFWFVHPARFFTLQEAYSSGGSYLKCVRNYSHLWTQGLSSQYDWGIYIKMRDGDIITRKVTGITDSTVPSYSAVFLDESIPRDINLLNHYIIGKMIVGRFDQDDMSFKLSARGQGVVNVKMEENWRSLYSWSRSSTSKESESSTTVSSESLVSVPSESSRSSYSKFYYNPWRDFII
jgi:hypothetical protein